MKMLKGKSTEKEYNELVKRGFTRSRKASTDGTVSGNTTPGISRQGTPTGAAIEWDPDTLDVVKAMEELALHVKQGEVKDPGWLQSAWRSLTTAKSENSFHDVLADLLSGRFLQFYAIPKVKFTVYFAGTSSSSRTLPISCE